MELSPPQLWGLGRVPSIPELCVILTCSHGLGGGGFNKMVPVPDL